MGGGGGGGVILVGKLELFQKFKFFLTFKGF